MDEDHPCRQCLDVCGCVAFSSAEAAWSHSLVTFPLPPAGFSKPDDICSPEPAPYSQLVPGSCSPPVRPGTLVGELWLCLSDTCPTYLPLLPAWDVTELQGKLVAMVPAHVLSPVISRGISARGGSRSVLKTEAQELCSMRRGQQQTGFSGVCTNLNNYSCGGSGFSSSRLLCPQCCFSTSSLQNSHGKTSTPSSSPVNSQDIFTDLEMIHINFFMSYIPNGAAALEPSSALDCFSPFLPPSVSLPRPFAVPAGPAATRRQAGVGNEEITGALPSTIQT